MILFFRNRQEDIYALGCSTPLDDSALEKLSWLFGEAKFLEQDTLEGYFIGPRKEMISPWSTNAVEISQNMGISGIDRIEAYRETDSASADHDPMLQVKYKDLGQDLFTIDIAPEPIRSIDDIAAYNAEEGLALSEEEITYLDSVSKELGRNLTDSEVFGFSQVNSEHCRHKIFNGTFIIDGQEMEKSLFQWIKKTSKEHPEGLVSAYKDNVAFIEGPEALQFAPASQDKPDFFENKEIKTVISLKAETHNFPTTVEPFNGAATGSGGEIRDRLAGGKGSLPLAGTAVYMTSYPRTTEGRTWEKTTAPRPWLYQSPMDILIKASDGASDFGNKFGQPLISGSVLTFEHFEGSKNYGFDKVIMMAGGIGFGNAKDSLKSTPKKGDKVIILGGDNYRIGMGGGAVSSVDTGEFDNAIELNAIQRSNPEMQKRVMNAIRALQESSDNSIISIHDHGAGGHLNCLSELVEETGGTIDIHQLPIGDPTLSDKEIVGNESQERMGLVMNDKDIPELRRIAERERAPMYIVGETTDDLHFRFENKANPKNPIDWSLKHMFGSSPKTVLEDRTPEVLFAPLQVEQGQWKTYLDQVLQLEAVACKDWLTNKVDRSVTGKVAHQQTCGTVQLPLNDVAVMALDFTGENGVATAIGHAPGPALIDPIAGSTLAIAEALTNIVWAPLSKQLSGVSLSANWMWPAKNEGENARLYAAVKAVSDFACDLGINIPTGKDSLSMTQKYPKGDVVYSPGTVIISAAAEVNDLYSIIHTALVPEEGSHLLYIDFSKDERHLGGSSFAQVNNAMGRKSPTVKDAAYFKAAFNAVQELIQKNKLLAGHDLSAGGLITTVLEMCFPNNGLGLELNLDSLGRSDEFLAVLFSENPGVVFQTDDLHAVSTLLKEKEITFHTLGQFRSGDTLTIQFHGESHSLNIPELRNTWFKSSYLLDKRQSGEEHAKARFDNYAKQVLEYRFPKHFNGKLDSYGIDLRRQDSKGGITAAIIREKGVNGDREMAHALYMAGFDVKDVHMTDLIQGRETLESVQLIVFVGGFSNSDVLGSAKGWAGAFLYNERAKAALDGFYAREDTLSLGVCNGCQLMMELELVFPQLKQSHPKMRHNASGKFESQFVTMDIEENNSVMLHSLSNARLGVWVAHGEGRFDLPGEATQYGIVGKYSYEQYPGNPNGSDHAAAALCSEDGRHLALMPHLERTIFPWNWAHYPEERRSTDQISPWIEAFINAYQWFKK